MQFNLCVRGGVLSKKTLSITPVRGPIGVRWGKKVAKNRL